MSVVSGNAAVGPSLRRLPFAVRVAPSFINPVLNAAPAETNTTQTREGLLFGAVENGSVAVKRAYFCNVKTGLDASVAAAQKDEELKALSVVGWYAERPTGGLVEDDVRLHQRAFAKPVDLAFIIRPEGTNEIVCEIYSRSSEGVLSSEGYRWGLLRLTRGTQLEDSAEVAMRAQMQDDYFLRAYEQPDEADDEASADLWKRAFGRFRRGRKDAEKAAKTAEVGPIAAPAVLPPPLIEAVKPVPMRPAESPVATVSPAPAPRAEPKPVAPPAGTANGATSNDVTREMPRELLREALRQGEKAPAPPADRKTPQIIEQPAPAQASQELTVRRDLTHDVTPVTAVPVTAEPLIAKPVTAQLVTEEPPSSRARLWVSAVAIFGIAATGTFAVVHYRLLPGNSAVANNRVSPLGLKLEGQGQRILVTWDRNSAKAQNAVAGQLIIDDGPQHRTLPLEAAQISNGSVLYTPTSADITFRLQIVGRDGTQTDETLRVLDASRGSNDTLQVIPVDAPAPPTPKAAPKPQVAKKIFVPPTATLPKARATIDSPPPQTQVAQQDAPDEIVLSAPAAAPKFAPRTAAPGAALPVHAALTQTPAPAPAPAKVNTASAPRAFGSYSGPQPLRRVSPNLKLLSPGVTDGTRQVEVIVSIDKTGHVTAARLGNAQAIKPALAGASLAAAKGWVFTPAMMNGQPAASEHTIVFDFRPAPH